MLDDELFPGAFGLALLLGRRGFRRGSLSASGAVAAVIVGYLTLANHVRILGTCLIAFYLIGSRATKYKAEIKATLEDGHDLTHGAEGKRTATQVLCNSWLAALCSLSWRIFYRTTQSGACSLEAVTKGEIAPSALIMTGVAFFGACMGDTLASELGILASSKPRLIVNGRSVPPGTNGGITVWGTVCSLIGGLLIGMVAQITLLVNEPDCGLRPNVVLVGALSGVLGSLLDSLLGATLQETRYSSDERKILTEGRLHPAKASSVVSGRPILSNNGVNLVSSTIVSLTLGYLCQ